MTELTLNLVKVDNSRKAAANNISNSRIGVRRGRYELSSPSCHFQLSMSSLDDDCLFVDFMAPNWVDPLSLPQMLLQPSTISLSAATTMAAAADLNASHSHL
jgi:hypothetical protein